MPVEVIRALALAGVLLEELGEMTELMRFDVRALRCPIYRQLLARLKQAAYQERAGTLALRRAYRRRRLKCRRCAPGRRIRWPEIRQ